MDTSSLEYIRLAPSDRDIPFLLEIYRLPEISRFLPISESGYFPYVTSSPGVFYYKAYENGTLVGTVHLESDGDILDLALLVLPEHQNRGIGARILEDVKSGVLIREFSAIRISVDRDNIPSLHLFEKAGFVLSGEEDGLMNFMYHKPMAYYMAYEKRYRAVFAAGVKRWGHSPDDPVLADTLKKWVNANNLRGKRIIEYACGEGACGVILSRLGCIWHGTDVSPSAVEKSREAVREYPDASAEVLDMVKDTVSGQYDAALDCMGFHMLVTDADRAAYLKNACGSLKDGAPMLFFRQSYRSDGNPEAVYKGEIRSIEEWEAVTGSDYSTPQLRRTAEGAEVFIPLVPARANDRYGYLAEMESAGFAVENFVEMPESEAILYAASIYVRKSPQEVPMPNIIEITDLSHPALDPYARLTENQLRARRNPEKGIFIAESKTVVTLALDAGYTPVSLLIEHSQLYGQAAELAGRCGDVPIYTADGALLEQLTGFALSRGVLAVMRRPVLPTVEEVCRNAKRIAVLENIMDAANVGAIIRSAAALGMDAVLVTPRCSDPLLRRAARVSMGTVFQIPWTYIGSDAGDWPEKGMNRLRELGFLTASMALSHDTVSISDPCLKKAERLAILLGTEGTGLTDETIRRSDYTVKIPMFHGVDSLNVAAASAVAFWEICRGE